MILKDDNMSLLGNREKTAPENGDVPLKYRINPCDIDSYGALTPVRRFFEFFSKGTDCKCCLGARVFFALAVGLTAGFAVGLSVGLSVG